MSPSSCVKIIRIYWLIWFDLIGFLDSVVTQTGRVLPSIGKRVLLRTFYNYLHCKILLESPQSSTDLLRPYTVCRWQITHLELYLLKSNVLNTPRNTLAGSSFYLSIESSCPATALQLWAGCSWTSKWVASVAKFCLLPSCWSEFTPTFTWAARSNPGLAGCLNFCNFSSSFKYKWSYLSLSEPTVKKKSNWSWASGPAA